MKLINILQNILKNYPTPISNYRLMYVENVDITNNITDLYKENINPYFAIRIDPDHIKSLHSKLYNIVLKLHINSPKNCVLSLVDNNFVKYNIQSNKYFIITHQNGIEELIYDTDYSKLISTNGVLEGGSGGGSGGGNGGHEPILGGEEEDIKEDIKEDNKKVIKKPTMFYSNTSGCFQMC